MKDEEQRKKIVSENKQGKKVKKINPKDLQEQEQLFTESDKISPVNKKIDIIEIKTIGGEVINIAEYIKDNYVDFSGQDTHYTKERFYYPLADMYNVSRDVMDNYVKPRFVPDFINRFIISRFPQRVVDRLNEKNKYVAFCIRKYFHYQLMTTKADDNYRLFISQVEAIINRENNPSLKEFVKEYSTLYHLPYQKDLFDSIT